MGRASKSQAMEVATGVSASETITEMLRDLGHQLAALRRQSGLTQENLASLTDFSRSTVSLAEIGRQPHAREFWQACDRALSTGDALTSGFGQTEAVREAQQQAAARVAQETREARALAAFEQAQQAGGSATGVSAVQECPHCGHPVTVLTTLVPQPAPFTVTHDRS
jgi:transcriptional regulator with XRE-family HTH domain